MAGPELEAQEKGPEAVDFFLAEYPELDSAVIRDIQINGNDRTQPFIIHRELNLKKGDTVRLDTFKKVLTKNERQVQNTRLFTEVKIQPHWLQKGAIRLIINLKERWYSFPKPVFELADRNFNEWWVERDHRLSRTVYGLTFYQENLRGRNDELEMGAEFGFREQYTLYYTLPFITKTSQVGLRAGGTFTRTRKRAVGIDNDNLQFKEGEDYIYRGFRADLNFTYRQKIRVNHEFQTQFYSQWADGPILQTNADYFEKDRGVQRFFRIGYTYERDFRDLISYPKAGYLFRFSVEQLGLGAFDQVNVSRADFTFHKFWPLGNRFYWASGLKGLISTPGSQSFSIAKGLGYDDILVRGYEYDVINGQYYGLNRNSLRYRLLDTKFQLENLIPMRQFSTIPLAVYVKTYADQGYVVDNYAEQANQLSNRYLSGWGVGLDFVTFYDIVFRTEYSFNNRGEQDLFLHFVKPF